MKPYSKNLLLSAGTVAAIGLALTATSNAALLIYEPFDITNVGDALNGKATGTGLSGNWDGYDTPGNFLVGSGSLSYGSLQAGIGNHAMHSTTNAFRTGASASLGTTLSGAGVMADGAELWFSFLTDLPNSSGNNRTHFYIGTDGSNTGNRNILNSGSGIGLEISSSRLSAMTYSNGTRANSADTITPLSTSLILGRITWGAIDTIDLFLPATDLTFSAGSPLVTLSTALDQSNFDLLVIAGKDVVPVVDEIRFGETIGDVLPAIPEPSSTALLGLGGLALILRRCR